MCELNEIDTAVKELKRSKYPIAIWGGVLLGGKVAKWLEKNGISYDCFVVNRRFYKDSDKEKGIKILEDYIDEHKCVLYVAFAGFRITMLDDLDDKNVVKVYYNDLQGRFAANIDSKITPEMMEAHINDYNVLKGKLQDRLSLGALESFVHQKMYGEYSKEFSHNTHYFDSDILAIGSDEVFIDIGAYHGEDTEKFIEMAGEGWRAILFEPDSQNYEEIKNKFSNNNMRVSCFQKGISDHVGLARFNGMNGEQSTIRENGEEEIEITTIDEMCKDLSPTYIKMDIEGGEMNAIIGGTETIRRCHPKMAVCIYHRAEDVFEIPTYILSIDKSYRFYIRNYAESSTETVLYCV